MNLIPEKIIWFLENAEFLCIATLDENNKPRVANKFLIKCSENSIYLGDFARGTTYRNLKNNPQVSLAIMDTENLIDYQVNGKAYLVETGVNYKALLEEYSNREVRFSTKRLIEGLRKEKKRLTYQLPLLKKIVVWEIKVEEVVELGPAAELKKMAK